MADILLNLIMQNCAGNSCYLFMLLRPFRKNKKRKRKNGKKLTSCGLQRYQCFDKTEKWRKCSYLEEHILFSTFRTIDLYIRLHKNWKKKKEWCFDYYSLDELWKGFWDRLILKKNKKKILKLNLRITFIYINDNKLLLILVLLLLIIELKKKKLVSSRFSRH